MTYHVPWQRRGQKSMTRHVMSSAMERTEELRYLILGAQREGARAFAELLRKAGLTPAQAEVLSVLREADLPLTVRDIGDLLVCEGGSPSRLIASLVDAGLLQRGSREGDRRAVELSLTRRERSGARRRPCTTGWRRQSTTATFRPPSGRCARSSRGGPPARRSLAGQVRPTSENLGRARSPGARRAV